MPKYHNAETIPAKIFFEVLKDRDYSKLLPENETQEQLKAVFDGINDYYFLKSDNADAKEFLALENSILFLEYKMEVVRLTLKFLFENTTTKEMLVDIAKALKEGCDINIDTAKPLWDEIQRVLSTEMGYLGNDLNFEKINREGLLKSITPNKEEYDYYEAYVGLGNAMPGNNAVQVDMSLAVYIAVENAAKKIHKAFKQRQTKQKA